MNIPLHELLGIEVLERSGSGRVLIRLPYRDDWLVTEQPQRMIHGGIAAVLLDIATNFSVMEAVQGEASTVDLRIDYLRPLPPQDLYCEGRVLRAGQTLAVAEGDVRVGDGKQLAVGRGTFRVFR